MNTSEKRFQVPAAGVATATVTTAAFLAAIIGSAFGTVMAQPEEDPATTTYASPLIDPSQDEPYIDPIAQWKLENNVPFYQDETEYIDGPYLEPEVDSWVYPEVLPTTMPLVQMDGGIIHCQPWTTTASVSTRGGFTLNGQLVETWEDLNGLYVTPQREGIRPGRVAIIVDGERTAMLPETDGETNIFLPAYDWIDEMYFPSMVQLCIAGKNG